MKTKKAMNWSLLSKNKFVVNKGKEISSMYGSPDRIESNKDGSLHRATWTKIEGCEEVLLYGDVYKKSHPYPAIVFVIATKMMPVPDNLIGPLKYASETINIEQLQTNKTINNYYVRTGKKLKAKVSGSCASITISVITLKFVEDMVKKYSKNTKLTHKMLMKIFRHEYDKRVSDYLEGKGIVPPIKWYPNKLEKKEEYTVKV